MLGKTAQRFAVVAAMFALVAAANAESGAVPQSVKTARFANPEGVALDSKGNLYVADSTHGLIRKITPDGVVSTLAGADRERGNYPDGTGSEARFASPHYIAIDGADNVYVTKYNGDRIRKITPAGVVTTPVKELRDCHGVAADRAGNIYFIEQGFVRKMTSDSTVTTLAGNIHTCETRRWNWRRCEDLHTPKPSH